MMESAGERDCPCCKPQTVYSVSFRIDRIRVQLNRIPHADSLRLQTTH